MFSKWELIPFNVHWKLEGVDLGSVIPDKFELAWSRHSTSGSTGRVTPDATGFIPFSTDFEVPCKIYRLKTTGQVRPKLLELTLRRLRKGASTIYATATIDIGKYYGLAAAVQESIEMDSEHRIAPVLKSIFSPPVQSGPRTKARSQTFNARHVKLPLPGEGSGDSGDRDQFDQQSVIKTSSLDVLPQAKVSFVQPGRKRRKTEVNTSSPIFPGSTEQNRRTKSDASEPSASPIDRKSVV
jgi:hypothetical protein